MTKKTDLELVDIVNKMIKGLPCIKELNVFLLLATASEVSKSRAIAYYNLLFSGIVPESVDTFKIGIQMLRYLFGKDRNQEEFDNKYFDEITSKMGINHINRLALKFKLCTQPIR